ncbi:MAG TPA: glycolate oxidase subunit GlcE [Oceanospirillaceae bacterium]|nr:glycolate oxidase subunit GlcE [Oceanospirillaceae bacterium]
MTDMTRDLQAQVSQAIVDKAALAIQGGGTKSGLGRASQGRAICLLEHSGVISYSPTELVIQVRSGTKISDINATLAEHQQRLIFEPADYASQATIGGTVAANQSGPCRPWFGGVRDSVLGVGLINGLGEHLQFGGQVMKNVAGFDVSRSQVGAMGTLGVMTEISLKVLPMFAAEVTLVSSMSSTQALQTMPAFFRRNLPVSAVSYWQGNLYVRLQGSGSGVDSAMRSIDGEPLAAEQAASWWQQVRECQLLEASSQQVLWRRNVAATDAQTMCGPDSFINWGGAQRWQLLHKDQAGPEGAVQYLGGDRTNEVNGPVNSVAQKLQGKLKTAFDPHAIFNPGRLYSWM